MILLLAAGPLLALEFEGGGDSPKPQAASTGRKAEATVPQLIDVGDVPTAYGLLKYEMRADIRFYPGGGILNKIDLGIFPRFYIGGALNVPGLVAAGPVSMTREDASLLARLILVTEDENTPSIALGWDGPAFNGAELRGLYLALSKEFRTPLGFFQAHAGLNSSYFDNGWTASNNLRGSGALSTSIKQVTLFFEGDEINNAAGPRLNAGGRVFFDPISLGVEFRDLGATRDKVQSSRMLRVSYTGLF